VRSLFENKNSIFLLLVDKMAQRYGKTPYELLACTPIGVLQFNMAVMVQAVLRSEDLSKRSVPSEELAKFGVDHRVIHAPAVDTGAGKPAPPIRSLDQDGS
jgi:hypothetical protein